ncbi:hypothetical protein PR202_ga25567 [Eleusine coracana subsp. coracana]|uniref:HMA domain-containing protein n=1 Tax=Eleusine coracana subsp. coracana TaxID=191504 RepID=A0AAV5DBB5_ELECO|nr:hypothetical protein PR202_ga25567 [Eleusine coracana subsp. coracana]
MAKQRTKAPEDAAEAPKGAADTGTGVKEPSMASEKVAGDVVISAPVHCDGCARKLRRSLQCLEGERGKSEQHGGPERPRGGREREGGKIVERKTGRKATLLNPSPDKLPSPAEKGARVKKTDADGGIGDDITVVDTDMVIVLRINLHCDACCEEIKRRILKIEGVKEAAPLLKSSQMMVKGMVEPATLVGFIYKNTGRKAAIIRAEPLERSATREDDNNAAEKLGTEKPSDDDHGSHETHHESDAPTNGSDRVVLENNKKDDHLFRTPLPAGVVTVSPEMPLMNNFNPYYTYPPYPYAHLQHYYQYPPPYPHAYDPAPAPAMFGYPHNQPEALSEENPNACTIV